MLKNINQKTFFRIFCLILLNAFLSFPVFYNIGLFSAEVALDKVSTWNLATTLSFLLAINILCSQPFYLHLSLLPVYLVVFIEWLLIYLFDSRLSAGYIWIGLSNLNEYKEFFETYKSYLVPAGLGFSSFYLFCLFNTRHIKWTWGKLPKLVSVCAFLFIYLSALSVQYMKTKSFSTSILDVIEHDQSIPVGIFSQSWVVFQQLKNRHIGINRKIPILQINKKSKTNEPEIHVLVIGESSRKNNWSLYGYERKTTPLLEKRDDLIIYDSIISNWPLTQMAVPLIVTDATIRQVYGFTLNVNVLNRPSIIHAFKEAHYKTFWITNQAFDRFAGNINSLANDADITLYSTQRYDYSLIELLRKQIKKEGLNQSMFVVLHTKGSHFQYENRYPKYFENFNNQNYKHSEQKVIDDYDNSILYTDYFLSGLIDYLTQLNVNSSITYISDHGENLYDDDRKLFGHNFSNRYDLPIPMIIWMSKKYKDTYPNKRRYAILNRHRKADFCNIFYTLLDMADLTYPEMKESYSLISENFIEHDRYIYNQRKHQLNRYELNK